MTRAVVASISLEPISLEPAPSRSQSLAPEDVEFWKRTWARLDKLEQTTHRGQNWKRGINDLTDAAAERRIAALSQGDEQDLFRTRLLQWHLERIKGRVQPELDPPRVDVEWMSPEPWLVARALTAGPTRCAAMLLALADTDGGDRWVRIATAEVQAREEWLGANVLGAAALAERVDALEPTFARLERAAWAMAQSGRGADAETLVRARIAEFADTPLEAGARVLAARSALASGDTLAARADLGAALALGSPEAAVLAARQLITAGDPRRARVLARGWLEVPGTRDVPDAMWALASLADVSRWDGTRAPTPGGSPLR